MGSVIFVVVLLTVSVLCVRLASVALRLTGLSDGIARFQALSAFSGTGFTTSEAEAIVNYPVRRQIVSLLMIVGNLGLVAVVSTLIVGFVNTNNTQEMGYQIICLMGGVLLVWLLMLSPLADRLLCNTLDRVLRATTVLGQRRYQRLAQIGSGFSVVEHPITLPTSVGAVKANASELVLLGVYSAADQQLVFPSEQDSLHVGDRLVYFGADALHETLFT